MLEEKQYKFSNYSKNSGLLIAHIWQRFALFENLYMSSNTQKVLSLLQSATV